ncbi:MAG: 30S ribosomal protein S5 [Patescibacteria group bacterium]
MSETKTPTANKFSGPSRAYRGRGGKPSTGARGQAAGSELEHKMIEVRRVTRVVKGGRRFSFSALVVAGDRRGRVGVGLGKAGDISEAIEKGLRQAKKRMVTVPLTKTSSVPHQVSAKFGSSRVIIRPAPNHGVVAGGAVRVILNLAGVRAVSGKIISPSKNKINNAKATIAALAELRARRD